MGTSLPPSLSMLIYGGVWWRRAGGGKDLGAEEEERGQAGLVRNEDVGE